MKLDEPGAAHQRFLYTATADWLSLKFSSKPLLRATPEMAKWGYEPRYDRR
jgi:hypothetical protein